MPLSYTGHAELAVSLHPAGNSGDDAYFAACLEGSGEVAEEADVFAVDVDVNEAADLAVVADDALLDPGESASSRSTGSSTVYA